VRGYLSLSAGFLELRLVVEAQLGHGVHDAPLHRFQSVTDVRQRPVRDYVPEVASVGWIDAGNQTTRSELQLMPVSAQYVMQS
jgi:hypothetical protein